MRFMFSSVICPHCQEALQVMDAASGNTFGAVRYTDGSIDGPMFPAAQLLARCRWCDHTDWNENFERKRGSESLDDPGQPGRWLNSDLSLSAYLDAANNWTMSAEDELRLRLSLWRMANRARRNRKIAWRRTAPYTDWEKGNMRRVLALLDSVDPRPELPLLRAELHRALGEHQASEEALDGVNDFPEARQAIQAGNAERDRFPRPIG